MCCPKGARRQRRLLLLQPHSEMASPSTTAADGIRLTTISNAVITATDELGLPPSLPGVVAARLVSISSKLLRSATTMRKLASLIDKAMKTDTSPGDFTLPEYGTALGIAIDSKECSVPRVHLSEPHAALMLKLLAWQWPSLFEVTNNLTLKDGGVLSGNGELATTKASSNDKYHWPDGVRIVAAPSRTLASTGFSEAEMCHWEQLTRNVVDIVLALRWSTLAWDAFDSVPGADAVALLTLHLMMFLDMTKIVEVPRDVLATSGRHGWIGAVAAALRTLCIEEAYADVLKNITAQLTYRVRSDARSGSVQTKHMEWMACICKLQNTGCLPSACAPIARSRDERSDAAYDRAIPVMPAATVASSAPVCTSGALKYTDHYDRLPEDRGVFSLTQAQMHSDDEED